MSERPNSSTWSAGAGGVESSQGQALGYGGANSSTGHGCIFVLCCYQEPTCSSEELYVLQLAADHAVSSPVPFLLGFTPDLVHASALLASALTFHCGPPASACF